MKECIDFAVSRDTEIQGLWSYILSWISHIFMDLFKTSSYELYLFYLFTFNFQLFILWFSNSNILSNLLITFNSIYGAKEYESVGFVVVAGRSWNTGSTSRSWSKRDPVILSKILYWQHKRRPICEKTVSLLNNLFSLLLDCPGITKCLWLLFMCGWANSRREEMVKILQIAQVLYDVMKTVVPSFQIDNEVCSLIISRHPKHLLCTDSTWKVLSCLLLYRRLKDMLVKSRG